MENAEEAKGQKCDTPRNLTRGRRFLAARGELVLVGTLFLIQWQHPRFVPWFHHLRQPHSLAHFGKVKLNYLWIPELRLPTKRMVHSMGNWFWTLGLHGHASANDDAAEECVVGSQHHSKSKKETADALGTTLPAEAISRKLINLGLKIETSLAKRAAQRAYKFAVSAN